MVAHPLCVQCQRPDSKREGNWRLRILQMLRYAHPLTSPRGGVKNVHLVSLRARIGELAPYGRPSTPLAAGPLQRPNGAKVDKSTTFAFHTTPLPNKFVTEWYKTQKGIETFDTFCLIWFLRREGDSNP